ncbi:MAG: RNA methyltransferase substrate-binding domain-containing protein, partial [Candidatus Hydrogenedentes bacterium]|nr:RNA methyltransferase substrate-binding domain-containing protein [Candidatus Hydrogenedentota bacterium]
MRREREPEYVIGRIPVLECLRVGKRRATKLYLLDNGRGLDELYEAATQRSVPIEHRSRRDLDQLSDKAAHQGAILEADSMPLLSLGAWLADRTGGNSVLVV